MPADKVIQHRQGTASEWTTVNPVLAIGEIGYETDTGKFKFGNGSSSWTALSYADTNTTYTAGTGLSLSGTEFSNTGVLSVNGDTGAISNVAKTNTANTFNGGAQSIVADLATTVPLTVTGASGQTANLFRVQTSAGTGWAVQSDANIYGHGSSAIMVRYILNPQAKAVNLGVQADFGATSTSPLLVQQRSPASVVLQVQGAASQTANLQEWQNSAGTVLTRIASTGALVSSVGIDIQANSTINGVLYTGALGSTASYTTNITISANRNVGLFSTTSYGGGAGVLAIANASTAPTSNPTGGGILFVDTGALKYRGTSGDSATIVNADGTLPTSGGTAETLSPLLLMGG